MPDVSNTLTGYLRNFSLWARHGFADKISATTATQGLLVQAKDAHPGDPAGAPHRVYLLEISVASGAPVTLMTFIGAGHGKP
jgi:hypothetical protein